MKFRLDARGGRVSRSARRSAAEQVEALLAAAALDTTFEMTQGGLPLRAFFERALADGLSEFGGANWPFEGELEDAGEVIARDGSSGVFLFEDGTLVYAGAFEGWFSVRVAAPKREQAAAALAAFSEKYPAMYRQQRDENVIPVTFWAYGQHGPRSRLRMIEASPWADIEGNYSAEVRDELGDLMDGFEPGKSGQLLLWQGPPGTGKTWALRALASEWGSWAEFNYITDPDAFFVSKPDYLIDVLLSDSYEELVVMEDESEEVVTTDRMGKWRVLILEDTGELLAANAKESYGQGLSRLLNVVDGLVGQGLRILVLVTTNDELGELHPAVKRPGRCASQIEFGPLSAADASEWLGEEVEEGGTLAELYARAGSGAEALEEDEPEEEIVASAEEEEEEPVEESPAERWNRLAEAIEREVEEEPEPIVAGAQRAALDETFAMMRLAAGEVEAARTREMTALAEMRDQERGLLREALTSLRALAAKPAGDTHVTVPTELHPHVTIHEPEITVQPSPAPDVSVSVEPPSVTVEAAHVELPEQQPPDVHIAAPEVHVTVEPPPRPTGAIKATKAEDGTTVFQVVDDD